MNDLFEPHPEIEQLSSRTRLLISRALLLLIGAEAFVPDGPGAAREAREWHNQLKDLISQWNARRTHDA